MLAETAGFDLNAVPGLRHTGYRQHKLPGASARVYQILHILTRQFSLRVSAFFAHRFNDRLDVDPQQIAPGLGRVRPADHVLWLNPTRAVAPTIDALRGRCAAVSLYFVDPVHRLGLTPQCLRAWASWAQLASYSKQEADALGIDFLPPYVPAFRTGIPSGKDLDLVYVGSPTPKRLLWLLYLRLHLRIRRRRGHLRLAARSHGLVRCFPGTFSERLAFADYAALCARSRGVLELHERDAGGVTLRATLSQALRAVHLCNLPTTDETCVISLWRWGALDRFLLARGRTPAATPTPTDVPGPDLTHWLRQHFDLNAGVGG